MAGVPAVPAVPALAAACLAAALKGDLTPNALDPKRAVCRFARLSRIQEEKKVPIFLGAEMGARRVPPRRGRGLYLSVLIGGSEICPLGVFS